MWFLWISQAWALEFAVIGDFGDDDTAAVAQMVGRWQPDLILTVGDNDYSDGASALGLLRRSRQGISS